MRVSAPTLWEEGTMSGKRVTKLAVIASALAIGIDLLITQRLGVVFDVAFVIVSIGAALAVTPKDQFRVGVLPPLLMLGVMAFTAVVYRAGIALTQDGFVQAVVSGLANHSGALFAACVNALVVLAIRQRVRKMRSDRVTRARSPYNVKVHSKRDASPAPYLITSGAPEEKSTMVVDSALASPESKTASSF
jgi:hypothetical protein